MRTRCGSEAYAAPELVTAGRGYERYDPRATDAWACGVVLFALCVRRLPFGEGMGAEVDGEGVSRGVIREEKLGERGYGGGRRGMEEGKDGKGRTADRRKWLMRIARGEYEWPSTRGESADGEELRGPRLVESSGPRRIVGRLLVRDPARRAAIGDLWDDEWMVGANGGVEGRLVDWEGVDGVVCEEVV